MAAKHNDSLKSNILKEGRRIQIHKQFMIKKKQILGAQTRHMLAWSGHWRRGKGDDFQVISSLLSGNGSKIWNYSWTFQYLQNKSPGKDQVLKQVKSMNKQESPKLIFPKKRWKYFKSLIPIRPQHLPISRWVAKPLWQNAEMADKNKSVVPEKWLLFGKLRPDHTKDC